MSPERDHRATRAGWVTVEGKYTAEWGNEQAEKLWTRLFEPWAPVVDGRTVLDLGCVWGYLLKYLDERYRPARLIGIDVIPFWERVDHGWDHAASERVELHEGDLLTVPLEPASVDLLLCGSVFQNLSPELLDATLARAFALLRPGGELLVRTQVYTSYLGAMLHRDYEQPYVHLLHGDALLRDRLRERGRRERGYTNWLTASSYLAAFASAGFEILDANRRMSRFSAETEARLARELPIAPEELGVGYLEARLLKPLEVEELDRVQLARRALGKPVKRDA